MAKSAAGGAAPTGNRRSRYHRGLVPRGKHARRRAPGRRPRRKRGASAVGWSADQFVPVGDVLLHHLAVPGRPPVEVDQAVPVLPLRVDERFKSDPVAGVDLRKEPCGLLPEFADDLPGVPWG
jgi:hypothetical protein